MKKKFVFVLFIAFLSFSNSSFAWSKKGHELVAEIAFHYLDSATKLKVLHYLNGISIEKAATWMDDIRKDKSFSYMDKWHYINIEKGETYKQVKGANIVTILDSVMHDLKSNKNLNDSSIKRDILMLFHLIGDLHQPLHVGYGIDKGGNDEQVSINGKGSNLHTLWDREIIYQKRIDLDSCLTLYAQLSKKEIRKIKKINIENWLTQSREFLPQVYDVTAHKVGQAYFDKNAPLVEKQLLLAGLRLSAVLQKLFSSDKFSS